MEGKGSGDGSSDPGEDREWGDHDNVEDSFSKSSHVTQVGSPEITEKLLC